MPDFPLLFSKLYSDLIKHGLIEWAELLPAQIEQVFVDRFHGKREEWIELLNALPDIQPSSINLDTACLKIGKLTDCDEATRQQLVSLLQKLIPWRKGPYVLFGIHIDTEWRSDWKWDRVRPHISPLKERSVLDIGCGNGYHMWRMVAEGARLVIGADPSQFFLTQFHVFKKYIGESPVHLLPFKSEELPAFNQAFKGNGFDTVFSMGVLYHRPSPIHHLQELKSFLRKDGELILETLILEGDDDRVLIPEGRYAKMRNVWFIPTTSVLERMLQRVGFKNIRVLDINQTSIDEQRNTDWMSFESLADFLDPNDPNKTIEGDPAPVRAVIICNADGA